LQQKARATASAKLAAALSEEALAVIKRVARQQKSAALMQLADRMSVLTQYKRVGGANPFSKIKQMVSEMLEKLQAELAEEMDEKEWCDFELSKTQESNEDLSDKIEGLKSKLDTAMSSSGQLKEDCKELHSSLADMAKLRKEMDSRRGEQRSSFEALKHDFEQGLSGVQAAISTLRKYYALNEDDASLVQVSSSEDSDQPKPPKRIQKSTGKGAELIGLLEIVEHDIASNIADADSEEEDQAAAYDKAVQENKVSVVELEQELKYKTAQYTALDKEITEMTNDYSTSSTELEARTEYLKKVQSKCKGAWSHVTFEDRKKKREAEMKGLLEAQAVLQGLQGGGKSKSFLQQRPKPATQQ
jgi:chromosome segregation ATPase